MFILSKVSSSKLVFLPTQVAYLGWPRFPFIIADLLPIAASHVRPTSFKVSPLVTNVYSMAFFTSSAWRLLLLLDERLDQLWLC